MESWLACSIAATVLWGCWGFIAKLASRTLSWQNLLLLSYGGSLVVFPVYLIYFSRHLSFFPVRPDYLFAVSGGIFSSLAGLFFYHALSKQEASRIVVITSMYPAITVLLACVFLQEPFTIKKTIGVILAVAAVYLLSV
ncbi:MAG: hypothetical protein A2V65_12810 [Deltaproteobacteria bacterium RBG_13_49_15]|nr:MAG: hypothetical protein A2V65_12810 [Deltaproteobacteria bacterium RBG_13_49_15]